MQHQQTHPPAVEEGTTTAGKAKRHVLVLRKMDPSALDIKYGFQIAFNLARPQVPPASTTIGTLKGAKHASAQRTETSRSISNADFSAATAEDAVLSFSYLDESKRNHHCVVTMAHLQRGAAGGTEHATDTVHHCFWCRHPFQNTPIGCPIRYHAHRLVKTYYSEISRDTYSLRENVSDGQLQRNRPALETANLQVIPKDYYSYDGIFCSFHCAYAFIKDQKANPLYMDSEQLLLQLYEDSVMPLHGVRPPLDPAPSWRLLKAYGGHMTIDEFRKNLFKVEYKAVDNILEPPGSKVRPVSFIFEKQVHI